MSERVFLGDVVRVIHGKNQRDVESEEGAYPIYGSGGIMGRANDYLCPAHTVIVGRKGTINHPIYVDEPFWNVDTAFGLVADKDRLLPRYLFHFCSHYDFMKLNTAATIPSLTKKSIQGISLMLPKVSVQRESCTKLDFVLSEIDEEQSMLESFDELVKSRFVEMFEPLFERDADDTTKLCDLAEIVSGITKGRKVAMDTPLREVPYMAVSNVKDGYIDWTRVKTIDATEEEIERYRLKPFDVLMTEGGDPDKLGRGALLLEPPSDCIHQNHVFRVRVQDKRLRPEYFEYYLQSSKAKDYFFSCAKRTTGIATINKKQISSLPVIVPPIEQQEAFIAFVQQVDKLKFDDLLTIRKFGCIGCKYV